MNRIFKIAVSVMLAAVVVVSCCTGFGAETVIASDANNEIYDEIITLDENEVCIFTDNIAQDYVWNAEFLNQDTDERTYVKVADCIDSPEFIQFEDGANYAVTIVKNNGKGYGDHYINFTRTAGEYRKARVKLSQYDFYFNEDGSRTEDVYKYGDRDFHFSGTEIDGEWQFMSGLMIVSGGMINFVAPDEDGFVEIYVCTNVGASVFFYTNYAQKSKYTSGGGGGYNGGGMASVSKGAVDGEYTSIDVTDATKIQLYMAKLRSFDIMQKYRADVNNNGEVDILDATKIQMFLAKLN